MKNKAKQKTNLRTLEREHSAVDLVPEGRALVLDAPVPDDVGDRAEARVGGVEAHAVDPAQNEFERLAKHPRLLVRVGGVAQNRKDGALPLGPGLLVALLRLEALHHAHDRLDEPDAVVPLMSIDDARDHHRVNGVVVCHAEDGVVDLLERPQNQRVARRLETQLRLHVDPELLGVCFSAFLELVRRIQHELVHHLLVFQAALRPRDGKLHARDPIGVELQQLLRALELHQLGSQPLDLRVDHGPGEGVGRTQRQRLVHCGERALDPDSELRLVGHLPRLEPIHEVAKERREPVGEVGAHEAPLGPDALADLVEVRHERDRALDERRLQLAHSLEHVRREMRNHVRRQEHADVDVPAQGFLPRAQHLDPLDAGLGGGEHSLVAKVRHQRFEAVGEEG